MGDNGSPQWSRLPEDVLCPDQLDIQMGTRGYRAAVDMVQKTLNEFAGRDGDGGDIDDNDQTR